MSRLLRLEIRAVRNIQEMDLSLAPGVNLIFGENGSGKTTILEAMYLLASGRSFRSSRVDTLINADQPAMHLFAEAGGGHRLGFSKTRNRSHQLKLDGELQQSWDSTARLLPVQLLDAGSFTLLEGGPKARRRFLDWGVFHVEPEFVSSWRRTRKCIANRNILLKRATLDHEQLAAWDAEFEEAAAAVDRARQHYFSNFIPVFEEVYGSLVSESDQQLTLDYQRGWEADISLREALQECRELERRYGATQRGPHRADVVVKQGTRPALEVLSRGQQKILVSALKIAQGILLSRAVDRLCVFLVDDLPAELDPTNREKILEKLCQLGGQLFLTCVEKQALESALPQATEIATFHVERGTITA